MFWFNGQKPAKRYFVEDCPSPFILRSWFFKYLGFRRSCFSSSWKQQSVQCSHVPLSNYVCDSCDFLFLPWNFHLHHLASNLHWILKYTALLPEIFLKEMKAQPMRCGSSGLSYMFIFFNISKLISYAGVFYTGLSSSMMFCFKRTSIQAVTQALLYLIWLLYMLLQTNSTFLWKL